MKSPAWEGLAGSAIPGSWSGWMLRDRVGTRHEAAGNGSESNGANKSLSFITLPALRVGTAVGTTSSQTVCRSVGLIMWQRWETNLADAIRPGICSPETSGEHLEHLVLLVMLDMLDKESGALTWPLTFQSLCCLCKPPRRPPGAAGIYKARALVYRFFAAAQVIFIWVFFFSFPYIHLQKK